MSDMPNFKHLIPESRKLLGSTISDLLNKFLTFDNRTLIMFDIETLGLNPSFDYEQITELAAYAFCGNSKKLIDKINFKVKLSETATEFLNNNDSIQRYKNGRNIGNIQNIIQYRFHQRRQHIRG